ncbi:MAG TPA: hypothetical protein VF323_00885 [Candidatus Limnocylindrales bacterium]
MHFRSRFGTPFATAGLALIVLFVAACGSTNAPTGAASPTGGVNAPATSAPSSASAGSPSAGSSATPAVSADAGSAPPVSGTGAKARPAGHPCGWLDKASIDASLGLDVGKSSNGGSATSTICTWLSKSPAGGITLGILTKAEVDGVIAGFKSLPGGRLVPGLGLGAAALFVTNQKSPLPKSHGQVFVDYGDWGLSVDVSGPAVTVEEAAALAVLAVL